MNKPFLIFSLSIVLASLTQADMLSRDPYVITKDLFANSGTPSSIGGEFDLSGALGETTAGPVMTNGGWELFPGYFGGGRLGGGIAVQILRTRVAPEARLYYQETLQVGVPLSGPVVIDFSDQIDANSIPIGVQIYRTQNHLGQFIRETVAMRWTLDNTLQQLTLTPESPWLGNSVYDVVINGAMQSISGYSVAEETHVFFQTVLDPGQENRLTHSTLTAGGSSASAAAADPKALKMGIPLAGIRDFAAVLSNRNPTTTPMRVNPSIIEEANRKARASSVYRIPLALREITGFNASTGERIVALTKPMTLTIPTDEANGAASPATVSLIRPSTLSLWVLDEEHKLWIKIPGSRVNPDGQSVTGAVSQLAVFAVMGSPSGVASDVYVFPNPWRPHGPKAGTNPGETGTEAAGMTFASVPSECRIKIFTLAGELVRELVHSDVTGSFAVETWDGKTRGGDPVASGAYFWRVESESDSKNGKLLIIR